MTNCTINNVEPSCEEYKSECLKIKNEINKRQGYLPQSDRYFDRAYKYRDCYICIVNDTVVGFGIMKRNGHLMLLGIHPKHQGEGYGSQLLSYIARNYNTITCHVRETNDRGVGFYQSFGFSKMKRINSYYDNGDAAYKMTYKLESEDLS